MELPDGFGGPKAVILNSRQAAYPRGDDSWVLATAQAVDAVSAREMIIITSLGMHTWELVLACAARHRCRVIVVPPTGSSLDTIRETICRDFSIAPECLAIIDNPSPSRSKQERLAVRDREVCEMADHIFPVSLRPGGNLDRLRGEFASKVNPVFSIPYEKVGRRRPRYDFQKLNGEITSGRWLVHFTRSCNGPRPRMSAAEYYLGVCQSGSDYFCSAVRLLENILARKVIFGSRKNIRDRSAVVAFTGLSDSNVRTIFRYRPRLINPNLEPFGLAISIDLARSTGISPAIYGDGRVYDHLSTTDLPFFQANGFNRQWVTENEWRYVGDFSFGDLPEEHLRIIVPTEEKADHFRNLTNIAVLPIFESR